MRRSGYDIRNTWRTRTRAAALAALLSAGPVDTAGALDRGLSLGYTTLATAIPGGRHQNIRTMRAMRMRLDGSAPSEIDASAIANADTWTSVASCASDGTIYMQIGWQSPVNAVHEELARSHLFRPGSWMLDVAARIPGSTRSINLSDRDRISHINLGPLAMPSGDIGFAAMIGDRLAPYRMRRDGTGKAALGGSTQFAYGLSASPDGRRIAYHAGYRVHVANADGSGAAAVESGVPFNFAPTFSPDGHWLSFVSGHNARAADIVIANAHTGALRRVISRGGYVGSYSIIDVPDHHGGSSDVPAWSTDGTTIYYAAAHGQRVDILATRIDGSTESLTEMRASAVHYAPTPSPDGTAIAYGTFRDGARQIAVIDLASRVETQITRMQPGTAAIWPRWCR